VTKFREKLTALRAELRELFVERDEVVDATLAAILSAHHVLLVGPPGTAKSMLAEQLCRRVAGADYFQCRFGGSKKTTTGVSRTTSFPRPTWRFSMRCSRDRARSSTRC
jgi:hypothetical protein